MGALFDLVQDYENADQEKRRTFKDFAFSDISAVFFNADEHAEEHNVDGKDVLVILEKDDVRDHSAHWEAGAKQNFDTGLYDSYRILYISVEDYGEMPQSGDLVTIDEGTKDQQLFTLKSCEDENGIYRMILERVRQG